MSDTATRLLAQVIKNGLRDIEAERTRSYLPGLHEPPDPHKVAAKVARDIQFAALSGPGNIDPGTQHAIEHIYGADLPEAVAILAQQFRTVRW